MRIAGGLCLLAGWVERVTQFKGTRVDKTTLTVSKKKLVPVLPLFENAMGDVESGVPREHLTVGF